MAPGPGADEDDVEALLAEVYADPDADAPRQRLAEVLSARADPRGEFITLQLQDTLTRDEDRRVRRLAKAHAKSWLLEYQGALVAKTVEWERGFPVSARLAMRKRRDERERVIGAPALATLRKLDVSGGDLVHDGEWLRRFLFESPLRGLRELRGLGPRLFADLLTSDPPWALRRLAFNSAGRPEDLPAIAAAAKAAPSLPHLVDLQLSYVHKRPGAPDDDRFYRYDPEGNYGWLWTTEFGRRLQVLRVRRDPAGVLPWLAVLRQHGDGLALERLVVSEIGSITLERGETGWTRLSGVFPSDPPAYFPGALDRALELIRAEHEIEIEIDGHEATR